MQTLEASYGPKTFSTYRATYAGWLYANSWVNEEASHPWSGYAQADSYKYQPVSAVVRVWLR